MNMVAFANSLSKNPALLFLLISAGFLLLTLLAGMIGFFVACAVNKRTKMTGLITVGLTLNDWPEDTGHEQITKLSCGEFLVSMQDPDQVITDRLDAKPKWYRKAACRQYEVRLLLSRFCAEFEAAGFGEDPVMLLLDTLLRDDMFYNRLGTISRRNAKTGLRHWGEAEHRANGTNPDKIAVYLDIPEGKANAYTERTQCNVRNLCITLEYHA